MAGSALVVPEFFDLTLEHARYDRRLFCPPNPALATVDHSIALHASALVRDGGTLQIGIGELGDAICYALPAASPAERGVAAGRSMTLVPSVSRQPSMGWAARDVFRGRPVSVRRRCSSIKCSICTGPVSCGGASMIPCRCRGLIASGNITDRFDARILEDLTHVGIGPKLTGRRIRHAAIPRRVPPGLSLRKGPHPLTGGATG